jgi:hypothetical protein
MDRLMKMWQVWNTTKINRVECDSHKNVRANRVETVQTNNVKTESNEETCSKSSVVVALCLLPTGKLSFGKNC